MKRSPMPARASKILPRSTALVARAPMKRSRPKTTKARKEARGQNCCVRFPGCPNATETTVLAHLRMFSGGGTGIKPPDDEAVFADAYCHDRLDGRVPWIQDAGDDWSWWKYIAWAIVRTIRARRKGI